MCSFEGLSDAVSSTGHFVEPGLIGQSEADKGGAGDPSCNVSGRGRELRFELTRGGISTAGGVRCLCASGLSMATSAFVDKAWKDLAYGFVKLKVRGSVICLNFSWLRSALLVNEALVWEGVLLLAERGVVVRVMSTGMPFRRSAEPSDTLRCGRPSILGAMESFVIDTFSGRRIGHCSSVGVPASASTSVRWALGGLAGFTN